MQMTTTRPSQGLVSEPWFVTFLTVLTLHSRAFGFLMQILGLFIPNTGEKIDFLILADRKYTFILQ